MNKNSTNYIRELWEKELNMMIAEEVWIQAWVTQSSTTNSLFWRDFYWKTLIRFFDPTKTPNQAGHSTSAGGSVDWILQNMHTFSGYVHMFSLSGRKWAIKYQKSWTRKLISLSRCWTSDILLKVSVKATHIC